MYFVCNMDLTFSLSWAALVVENFNSTRKNFINYELWLVDNINKIPTMVRKVNRTLPFIQNSSYFSIYYCCSSLSCLFFVNHTPRIKKYSTLISLRQTVFWDNGEYQELRMLRSLERNKIWIEKKNSCQRHTKWMLNMSPAGKMLEMNKES